MARCYGWRGIWSRLALLLLFSSSSSLTGCSLVRLFEPATVRDMVRPLDPPEFLKVYQALQAFQERIEPRPRQEERITLRCYAMPLAEFLGLVARQSQGRISVVAEESLDSRLVTVE